MANYGIEISGHGMIPIVIGNSPTKFVGYHHASGSVLVSLELLNILKSHFCYCTPTNHYGTGGNFRTDVYCYSYNMNTHSNNDYGVKIDNIIIGGAVDVNVLDIEIKYGQVIKKPLRNNGQITPVGLGIVGKFENVSLIKIAELEERAYVTSNEKTPKFVFVKIKPGYTITRLTNDIVNAPIFDAIVLELRDVQINDTYGVHVNGIDIFNGFSSTTGLSYANTSGVNYDNDSYVPQENFTGTLEFHTDDSYISSNLLLALFRYGFPGVSMSINSEKIIFNINSTNTGTDREEYNKMLNKFGNVPMIVIKG